MDLHVEGNPKTGVTGVLFHLANALNQQAPIPSPWARTHVWKILLCCAWNYWPAVFHLPGTSGDFSVDSEQLRIWSEQSSRMIETHHFVQDTCTDVEVLQSGVRYFCTTLEGFWQVHTWNASASLRSHGNKQRVSCVGCSLPMQEIGKMWGGWKVVGGVPLEWYLFFYLH